MGQFSITHSYEQYSVELKGNKAFISPIHNLTQYHSNSRDNEFIGTYDECVSYINSKGNFEIHGNEVYSKSLEIKLAFAEISRKDKLHISSSNNTLLLCGLEKKFKLSTSDLTLKILEMFDSDEDLCDSCRKEARKILNKKENR